jgi:lipopolysaccharide transport system permease protein
MNNYHYLSPIGLIKNLWQHQDLIRQFTFREIEGRYKGSLLGILWSVITPLVMLTIYTFVFGIIFRARWHGAKIDNLGQFAMVLFCGLTAYNIFSECITRAAGLVIGCPSYVKKVVFPLEILPVSVLGSALFHASVSFFLLLTWGYFAFGTLPWTLVYLPLVALPLVFLSLGCSWFLAGLGVFVRDINHAVSLVVQIFFFLTPIFYSVQAIPEPYQSLIRWNPLTPILENFRRVLIWKTAPDWREQGTWLILGAAFMLLGYSWFMKARRGFSDVI